MNKLRSAVMSCAAVALCGVGLANDPQHDRSKAKAEQSAAIKAENLTNQTFVTKAAESSMAEVALSRLALETSQDEQVREFAQRMVQDHEQANVELRAIAQQRDLQVPQRLDAKHQKKLEKLRGKSGAAFDAAYSKAMAKDHEMAVKLFRSASRANQLHEDLRTFAEKTLPTLETHNRLASNLPGAETRAAQAESESTSR